MKKKTLKEMNEEFKAQQKKDIRNHLLILGASVVISVTITALTQVANKRA